jgi:hypothetical protein
VGIKDTAPVIKLTLKWGRSQRRFWGCILNEGDDDGDDDLACLEANFIGAHINSATMIWEIFALESRPFSGLIVFIAKDRAVSLSSFF